MSIRYPDLSHVQAAIVSADGLYDSLGDIFTAFSGLIPLSRMGLCPFLAPASQSPFMGWRIQKALPGHLLHIDDGGTDLDPVRAEQLVEQILLFVKGYFALLAGALALMDQGEHIEVALVVGLDPFP